VGFVRSVTKKPDNRRPFEPGLQTLGPLLRIKTPNRIDEVGLVFRLPQERHGPSGRSHPKKDQKRWARMFGKMIARCVQLMGCVLLVGLASCSSVATSADATTDVHRDSRWTIADHALKDATTGLQWTASDNGADINWTQAQAYCSSRGGGWRLPAIDELASLYAGKAVGATTAKCGDSSCRTTAPLALSAAWFWSSTPVGADAYDGVELAWGLSLANGVRTQSVKELSYGSRALCVHDAKSAH
jgi:hypothetical protein